MALALATAALLGLAPGAGAAVSFSGPTNFAAGVGPVSVAVGDFNADGDPDLAVANDNNPGTVSVLLGQAGGGFSAPTPFAAGGRPFSVAVGDFNGDGDPDLAVANDNNPGTVSVLLGQAGGGFSAPTPFAAGSGPFSVAVGDFNADGDPDLAVAVGGGVSVLLGQAGGAFSAPTPFPAGSGPLSVAVGDFNADGDPDLAVANNNRPDTVSVLLGQAGGAFSAPTPFPAGGLPRSVAVGDFNGDGDPDLAVVGFRGVSVLLGQAGGGFSDPTLFAAGDFPESVAVGDFNADGDPDLAVANGNSGNVSVLLNTSLPVVSLGATSLAFGEQAVGTIGGVRSVTVTNTGDGSLRVSRAAVAGADANDFLVTGDSCTGERITKGSSCSLSVRFAPTALGARSATLRISSNDPASPGNVALSGTGTPPASGSAGATGPAGPGGSPGADGATGPVGPGGPAGSPGPGSSGPAGSPGQDGAPGPQGSIGSGGPAGSTGPGGPAGLDPPDRSTLLASALARANPRRITMTRSGTVTLRIPPEACPALAGTANCKGAVDLRTVDPARLTPRGRLTRRILASASYQLRPGAQTQATLRLSKRQRSLLQRRGRLLVIATVTTVLDQTGKLTSTGYPFVLLRTRRPVS